MFRKAYDKIADEFSTMSKVKFEVIHGHAAKRWITETKIADRIRLYE